ncbi:MAG: CHAT domain-containing protein [Myxococcota bacterium]
MGAAFSGCERVLVGPVCQFHPGKLPLRVWLDLDPRIPASVHIDGRRIDAPSIPVEGGQRFEITPPDDARHLEFRATLDEGPGVFRLRLALSTPQNQVLTNLWIRSNDPAKRAAVRRELETLPDTLNPDDRAEALTLRAALARDAELQSNSWYDEYDDAIEAALKVGRHSDAANLAHQGSFFALHFRNDDQASEAWLRRAAEYARDDPERRMAQAYHEGLLERARGNTRAALQAFERNEIETRKLGLPAREASVLSEQANLATRLGAHDRARELAARARELEDELEPATRAQLRSNLGWMMLEARSRGVATEDPLPLLTAAYEELHPEDPLRPDVQLNLGYAAILRGDADEGQRWLDMVDAPSLDRVDGLWLRLFRARVALLLGKAGRAQRELQALLDGIEPHDELELRLLARVGLGETHEALGRADRALADYRAAQALLDRQLPRIAINTGRGRFAAERNESTRRMVDLQLRQGDTAQALCIARRSRTRVLRVLSRQLRHRAEASPAHLSALQQYRRRRSELESRFDESFTMATIAGERERRDLKAALLENEQALDRVLDALGATAPEPVACEDLPAPGPGQLDLHYMRLDDGWVVFAHDDRELAVHRLGPLPLDREPGPIDFDADRLAALGQTLLGPHAEALARATQVRVMATGALGQVPFHALPVAGAGSPRLLERVAVGYGLDLPGPRTAAAGGSTLAVVVAPPSNLAHAPAEVEAIEASLAASFSTVRRLQDGHATGQQVREVLPRATLLHYVGHARAEGLEGWDSALQLARNTTLGIGDILSTDHALRTVVLNGCETGTVDPQTLAGGMSLAHAFVLSGASTVIATTRTVDDAAAAELMRAFHAELATGATALQALRQAQRARPATDETMLHARAWVP